MEGIRSFFCLKPKEIPFSSQEKAEDKMVQGYCLGEKKNAAFPSRAVQ